MVIVMVKTSARGSVSQLGEVKVKPLSVPASRGKTCNSPIVLSSFHHGPQEIQEHTL